MSNTEVDICNSALTKVGADTILSLDDKTRRARLCKELYPKVRDALLRSHPWNFAIARKELAQTANTPEFGFANEFAIPVDVLRILEIDTNFIDGDYKIEQNKDGIKVLVTDFDAVKIKYIKKMTNVSLMDDSFQELLAWKLASELAYPLTQNASLAQLVTAEYKELLSKTRNYDAQEGGQVDQVESNEWLDARF